MLSETHQEDDSRNIAYWRLGFSNVVKKGFAQYYKGLLDAWRCSKNLPAVGFLGAGSPATADVWLSALCRGSANLAGSKAAT
jgi:hypothetical protein